MQLPLAYKTNYSISITIGRENTSGGQGMGYSPSSKTLSGFTFAGYGMANDNIGDFITCGY